MTAVQPRHLDSANRKNERERRRVMVAALLLSRRTYRQMVEDLARQGVTAALGTISNDVREIRRQWQERARESYDGWIGEEVAKIDALEGAVMPMALRGDLDAVHRMVELLRRRAKLLGLDREMTRKVEVSGADGGPIELAAVDSVRQRGLALVTRLEERRAIEAGPATTTV